MNVLRYVEDLDLSDGQKFRGKCPECNRSNTFTATNNMGKLIWNCYANICSLSGAKTILMSAEEIRKRMQDFKIEKSDDLNRINIDIFSLPDHVRPLLNYDYEHVNDCNVTYNPYAVVTEFCERYGLWAKDLNLHYDVKESRIVFPVEDNGKLVDAVGRAVDDNVIPKWKRYGNYAEGFVRGQHKLGIVVEAVVSACVIETLGATGVAILGTSMNIHHIQALKHFKRVIVALDPDAAKKTIEYTKILKSHGVKVLALKLTDDIKYRKLADVTFIKNTIEAFNGTFTNKEFTK